MRLSACLYVILITALFFAWGKIKIFEQVQTLGLEIGDETCLDMLGAVYMIPGWLSHWHKFAPGWLVLSLRHELTQLPSISSVFVYMMPPKNVMLGQLTPVRVYPGCCTEVNSCLCESPQHDIFWWHHVNKYRANSGNWSELPCIM